MRKRGSWPVTNELTQLENAKHFRPTLCHISHSENAVMSIPVPFNPFAKARLVVQASSASDECIFSNLGKENTLSVILFSLQLIQRLRNWFGCLWEWKDRDLYRIPTAHVILKRLAFIDSWILFHLKLSKTRKYQPLWYVPQKFIPFLCKQLTVTNLSEKRLLNDWKITHLFVKNTGLDLMFC